MGEVLRLRTALASGTSVLGALTALADAGGPWAPRSSRTVAQIQRGISIDDALADWSAERDGPALVADALAIARATGGSQVGALDAVATALRDRRSIEREVRALSAQARASAALVVAAPIVFAIAVASVDERVRSFFLGSFAGLACIAGGVALDAVGAWWMAALVRRVR